MTDWEREIIDKHLSTGGGLKSRAALKFNNEISAITGKPMPTTAERFAPAKAVGQYIRGNVMGRAPEGKWLDKGNIGLSQRQTPLESPRVSGRTEERLYAEPEYNWEMGEVDAFHGGGMFRKFSDKYMKTGTGGHVFGWGHYVSEEKGVAKYYKDLYSREHGSVSLKFNSKTNPVSKSGYTYEDPS